MKRSKPDRELTDEERNVVIAVRHCAGELNDILQGARRKAQLNTKLFSETGISVMFRGIESYADMYEKLAIKSREGLERLFFKFSDCEEVQDTQDAIEETEGNWHDFLKNLDRDASRTVTKESGRLVSSRLSTKCQYFITSEYPLIDMQTNKEVTLGDHVGRNTCVFVTFQPSYWPDTCVRWRYSEVQKVKADLVQFNVGFVVVTWGPPEVTRAWSKQLFRATKWPILWDKEASLCSRFGFGIGLELVWAAENLDFLGCQRAMHNRLVNPPPTDMNWSQWRQIGGEAVIARPVLWDANVVKVPGKSTEKLKPLARKRPREEEHSDGSDDEKLVEVETNDIAQQAQRDREAVHAGETKICLLHQSMYLADMVPSGYIYQAALTCYARAANTTEAFVMDRIRQNRRFSTAPETARLQYEETSGLYYDPETALYYDSARGYFYDSTTQTYYYWSQSEHRYIPANALIQAEMVAAHAAQLAAAQAAARRTAAEREAAKQAALHVAAQLAEIRAGKDDYAAYAYATCVIPQQEASYLNTASVDGSQNVLHSVYRNTAAAANNIATSMRTWDDRPIESLVPYADDMPTTEQFSRNNRTPPPPGL
ncbi:uncharacterized protein DEA37_0001227 [Paragonimus westermani]|uniref:OCRE domain-containing protein n=1 Tax=Paragonimus westermani TaxID=34504 RepID=A0A5J4N9M2_9TREM|nr:uncharacterized protein DEA37_0001227 [Paragonimus westermani]